jgi:hypothetical protein
MRLYLPGVDCIAELVSGKLPRNATGPVATVVPTVPATTTTTTTTVPVATTVLVPGVVPPADSVPIPSTTVFKGPVVSVVDPGTTIAPTETNPAVPVVGVDPQRYLVYDCAKGLPKSVRTVTGG